MKNDKNTKINEDKLLKMAKKAKLDYKRGKTKLLKNLADLLEEAEDIKAIEERKDEKGLPFKGNFAASI